MVQIQKILYATDLSQSAVSALHWAITLAEQSAATVSVVHVIPDMMEEMSASMGYDLFSGFDVAGLAELNEEGRAGALKAVEKRIRDVCDEVKTESPDCSLKFDDVLVRVGHPVREIIDVAVTGNFDLVVMGTHGHSLLDGILLGSVARGVVQKCPVPVLTIRLSQ